MSIFYTNMGKVCPAGEIMSIIDTVGMEWTCIRDENPGF